MMIKVSVKATKHQHSHFKHVRVKILAFSSNAAASMTEDLFSFLAFLILSD